jgi:hypothetical protein
MSTPSLQPLDDELISPYAPKHARDQVAIADPVASPANDTRPRPAAIETENDARILDEIECSLREMIASHHLSDSEKIASDPAPAATQAGDDDDASASEAKMAPLAPRTHDPFSETAADAEQLARHLSERPLRIPPAFLMPAPEREPDIDPWPPVRMQTRRGFRSWLVGFAFAAGGAAAVAMFALPDLRTLMVRSVGQPLADISTNAAAVYREGQVAATTGRETASAQAPVQVAALPAAPAPLARPAMPRETVMAAIDTNAADPVADRAAGNPLANAAAPAPTPAFRPAEPRAPAPPAPVAQLTPDEIALLRKQADDYIASGDFAGARVVLERAADADDASAAFTLAQTYDPAILARFKVRGLAPDNVKAARWYERARDLGSAEAPRRLNALARGE